MNDDDRDLNREWLERATSRAAVHPGDEDARRLQDDFLSLGRALDAAQQDWSEAELLARLDLAGTSTERADSRGNGSLVYWLAAGVLAASALFATARILLNDPGPVSGIAAIEPAAGSATEDAVPGQSASKGDAPEDNVASTQQQGGNSAVGTWADPLDRELTAASQAIDGYAGFDTQLDRSLANVQGQLESLADDLATGSL